MTVNNNHYLKYMKYKQKYNLLKQTQTGGEKSLYDRLGGVFAIAAVVDHFSDAIVENPLVGKDSPNLELRDWHRNQLDRLPGLKFMRTLWVSEATGGPFKFTATVPGMCHMSLENAHEKFHIAPIEFDEVANILKNSLEHFKVPEKEKNEVLAAFASHKVDVTKGYYDSIEQPIEVENKCPFSRK